MSISKYKGYSLRNRIFVGFLVLTLISLVSSALISFYVFRNSAREQSKTQMQQKSDALMSALDYAVSHRELQTKDLPAALENELLQIADINKQDIILYDLNGNFLISNRAGNLIAEKKLNPAVLHKVKKTDKRVDINSIEEESGNTLTSSYVLLKNNMLVPVAVVYMPSYHNNTAYMEPFNKYLKYIAAANIVLILLSILLSWFISKNLTTTLTNFADRINRLTLFTDDQKPIRYYKNDELGTLVKAYNQMLLQIQDQKDRLSHSQREHAWREMAQQIAHEVKNPLTPMKLMVQNFDRRFDPTDPDIREKLSHLTKSLVDQIDLIATVATAFSDFAQLPDKHDETFNLVTEVDNILQIFSSDKIFIHSNRSEILIRMDRIFLNRIITNLVTNSVQAESPERPLMINVDMEQVNKKVRISVEDNGTGIPPELQQRIFEPNFTSKSSGMGLGLSMVRKMVEDYGGEITVHSEPGKYARFIIFLPANLS